MKLPFLMKKTFIIVTAFIAFGSLGTLKAEPLATVAGQTIDIKQIEGEIAGQVNRAKADIYRVKRDAVMRRVDTILLNQEAKKKGKPVAQLLNDEAYVNLPKPTDEDLKAVYSRSRRRFGNQPFKQVIADEKNRQTLVRSYESIIRSMAKEDYLNNLRKKSDLKLFLEPHRVEVAGGEDDPSKGPKNAPIQLIEFTEYQCPYCARVRPTIDELLKKYDGKIHYVMRDFPLNFHRDAKLAAQAASCAGEQKKFWEYNDILWKNQRALKINSLKKYAQDLKLNMKAFETCLSSPKYAKEVDLDQRDGQLAGVSGTPAFFVNGIFLSGAQPLENFIAVIEDELIRIEKKSSNSKN